MLLSCVPATDEPDLAHHLLDAVGGTAAAVGRPVWVMVLDAPRDRLQLAVADAGFDPLGWSAPPPCRALAMVATGRVRPLEEAVELPASLASGVPGGVRMACVVSRTGRMGWHMILPDGSAFDEMPESGRVLDVMLRCLDLPTPPPADPADTIVAYGWLAALLDADPPQRPLGWSRVLDFHPALSGCDQHLDAPLKEAVIEMETGTASWEDARQAVADGYGGESMPPPELAAWMDEGMFSRWILAMMRPLEDMLDEVRPRLRPAAARRLAHMVRATG